MNSQMRAKDWFTVGLRLLGVWMLTESAGLLAGGAEIQFGLTGQRSSESIAYLVHAAVDLAAGVALLRTKVSLFWPEADPDDPGFEVIQNPENSVTPDSEEKA